MSSAASEVTPGVVLHARPLRENSRVVELVTERAGRVAAVARGRAGSVRPFVLLDLAWRGRGELPSLNVAEERRVYPLTGRRLVCGLYLNELVLRLFPRDAPLEDTLQTLTGAYTDLAQDRPADRVLRRAEWQLLGGLDSGLAFIDPDDLEPEAWYRYEPEHGLHDVPARTAGAVPGAALQALASGRDVPDNLARASRDFMRALIDAHLDGRPLQTRGLL
ncbi:DNA repair protein RecO [Thioalkalivibrio sp. ALE23]|uniref:DNA repair protein RecO n=1 Tax=Thioalkalivibrio sp. ALE23 TaxID=1265495 RepID=UPI00036855A6|nr:recombination protein O N-terminal domain-containing protein [Thioalkalivibrio sp. ALE23]